MSHIKCGLILITQVFLIYQDISRAQKYVWIYHFSRPRTQTVWQGFNRSHKRGKTPKARGLRVSIEIAKCATFRSNCASLNVPISRGNPANLHGYRVEFQEMDDCFATLFGCSLNLPFASYLNRQCMHRVRMSKYYINITWNTRLSQTNLCNTGKNSLAESRTWTICTEGRLLDHVATLPRKALSGKIIILKVFFPWNSNGKRCLKLVELHSSWIQRYIGELLTTIIICYCF